MDDSTTVTDVLLVSADLFLGSRVRSAVEAQGRSLAVALSEKAAADKLKSEQFRLVLVDLETPHLDVSTLVSLRNESDQPAFVAYGPHVKVPLLESARQSGCDEVLTRGKFDASVRDVLARYLDGDD